MTEVPHVSDTIELSCEFRNKARTLTDPTAITLSVKAPSGTTTIYTYAGSQVQRRSAGIYYYELKLNASGTWEWRWVGEGAVEQADQGRVYVLPVNT